MSLRLFNWSWLGYSIKLSLFRSIGSWTWSYFNKILSDSIFWNSAFHATSNRSVSKIWTYLSYYIILLFIIILFSKKSIFNTAGPGSVLDNLSSYLLSKDSFYYVPKVAAGYFLKSSSFFSYLYYPTDGPSLIQCDSTPFVALPKLDNYISKFYNIYFKNT